MSAPIFRFGNTSLNRIDTLEPDLQRVLSRAMSWQIMDFSVTQARRSHAEHTAIYAQGRQPHDVVNQIRAKAGLGPISMKEAAMVVTQTMQSSHLPNENGLGEAFDVAPYPYDPNDTKRAWMLQGIIMAAAAAEGVKVRSGADFNRNKNFRDDKFVDLPHIELDR